MYEYRVSWYNIDGKLVNSRGIVIGRNYPSAIAHVIKDYGEDNIEDIYLKGLFLEGEYTIEVDDIREQFEL